MRGLGTDHVISGPMRGLKKMHPKAHTTTHRRKLRFKTESAPWENMVLILVIGIAFSFFHRLRYWLYIQ